MRKNLSSLFLLCSSTWLLMSSSVHAEMVVEVTGSGSTRLPIAISTLDNEDAKVKISSIVRADLEGSGLFKAVEAGPTPMGGRTAPDFAQLKSRGADALLGGVITTRPDGLMEAQTKLFDVPRQANIDSLSVAFRLDQQRAAAHRIADAVYEKLTGVPGVFSTRIAYVVKTGKRYELRVADADGMNEQPALISYEPIISPAWSPDGKQIAYVSFEAKKPIIYIRTLASQQLKVLANFKGSNSAPAWAPNGKKLAIVLTKDGRSQLYTVNADGSGLQRLSSSYSIDTEPFYSPDGEFIYFTSDRGGSPQIYRVNAYGGQPERVTFEGEYNVTPRISPDGKYLAYITRNGNRFQLAIMDLATKQAQVLTDTQRDESPSFSPNSRMLLYATSSGGRDTLAAISIDGKTRQKLSVQASDVREPTWGPLIK